MGRRVLFTFSKAKEMKNPELKIASQEEGELGILKTSSLGSEPLYCMAQSSGRVIHKGTADMWTRRGLEEKPWNTARMKREWKGKRT